MWGHGSGCLSLTLLAQMEQYFTIGEGWLMKEKNIHLPGLIRWGFISRNCPWKVRNFDWVVLRLQVYFLSVFFFLHIFVQTRSYLYSTCVIKICGLKDFFFFLNDTVDYFIHLHQFLMPSMSDNACFWEIFIKINIWMRSNSSRENVKFWERSFRKQYDPLM